MLVSAKTGSGVDGLLERLVTDIPAPEGDPAAPLQALIVDSWFDNYLGVVSLVRVVQGSVKKGERILAKSVGRVHVVDDVGRFTPKGESCDALSAGEVGYVVAGIKQIQGAPVGDTLVTAAAADVAALPGFERAKPQVYAGMFPTSSDDFENFRDALAKLTLNDAALFFEPETSDALGFGFRCGFLGMLHMEIVQERLEREYDLDLVTSAPTVIHQVATRTVRPSKSTTRRVCRNRAQIAELREPIAEAHILVPQSYLGNVINLCQTRRGRPAQRPVLRRPGRPHLRIAPVRSGDGLL